jgi:hypothetical protein
MALDDSKASGIVGDLEKMLQKQYKLFQFVGATGLLLFQRGMCLAHLRQEGQPLESTRNVPMGKTLEDLVVSGDFKHQKSSRIFHLTGLKDSRQQDQMQQQQRKGEDEDENEEGGGNPGGSGVEGFGYLEDDVESLAVVPFGSHGLVLLCNSDCNGFDLDDGAFILQVRDEMKTHLLKNKEEPQDS